MADSSVAITAGSGTAIDTFTQAGGDHRQAMVLGDASAAYTVAVDSSGRASVLITDADTTTTGTISATDAVVAVHGGAGVLLNGTPTANSYVAMAMPGGESGFIVQVTGTFGSGTVWFECSANSTTGVDGNWTTLSLRTIGTNTTVTADFTTAAGLFRGNAAGMAYVRLRITGATTPSVACVIRTTGAEGPTALNAPIPTGTNTIGTVSVQGVSIASQTLPITAATPVTGTGLDVSNAGAVTFILKNTVAATVWTGTVVVVFEQSDDNVSWALLPCVRSDTGAVASTHTFLPLAANASVMMDAGTEGINWVRARVTTAQTTNGATVVTKPGGLAFSPSVTNIPHTNVGRVSMAIATAAAGVTAGTTATEALITVAQAFRGGVTFGGGTSTSVAITANKTYRITNITFALKANAALVSTCAFTLRYNPTGAAITTSAPLIEGFCSVAAVANQLNAMTIPIGDGVDLPGGTTPGQFCVTVNPVWVTTAPTLFAAITGYEY